MQLFPDSFTLAPEPQSIINTLVSRDPDFSHLRHHHIGCLFSQRPLTDRGTTTRAITSVPAQITAKLHERQLLEWTYTNLFRPSLKGKLPDFVIYFDHILWL